jgi:GT2 family glycosyltransferase
MSAAVLDIELSDAIPDIDGLDRYTAAYIVLRFHGIPVGHCWASIADGKLDRDAVNEGIRISIPSFSRRWVERQLVPAGAVRPPRAASARSERPSATVAICTRDRPEDLARALPAVLAAAGGRHVLVVDNCPSSDRTRDLVRAHPGVRYVCEQTPGLNAARNRALAEAETDVVAFTDDDAVPEPAWLDALLANFDHPMIMAVTGLTLPLELETPAQEWFQRYTPFGRGYFRHEFDPLHCSAHSAGQIGAGASMAIRRDVTALAGGFDERLDAGTPTRSGGDHEMFTRILDAGYRIVYEPAAVSRHRHRRSWDELQITIHGYGVGVYAMWTARVLERHDLSVLRQAFRWAARVQMPALAGAVFRRPGAPPLDLVLAELRGCALGPWAWWQSRGRRIRAAA